MTAEAKEFRETLPIERALHEDPAKGRQWLRSQTLYDATSELFEDESETLS